MQGVLDYFGCSRKSDEEIPLSNLKTNKSTETTNDTNTDAPSSPGFLTQFLDTTKKILGHQITKAVAGALIWTGAGLSATVVGSPVGLALMLTGFVLGGISVAITTNATINTDVHGNVYSNGGISVIAMFFPPAILYFGDAVGVPSQN